MHRPAGAIGILAPLNEAQPVSSQMQEEILHTGEEAWQCADKPQFIVASHRNLALRGKPRP